MKRCADGKTCRQTSDADKTLFDFTVGRINGNEMRVVRRFVLSNGMHIYMYMYLRRFFFFFFFFVSGNFLFFLVFYFFFLRFILLFFFLITDRVLEISRCRATDASHFRKFLPCFVTLDRSISLFKNEEKHKKIKIKERGIEREREKRGERREKRERRKERKKKIIHTQRNLTVQERLALAFSTNTTMRYRLSRFSYSANKKHAYSF